MVYLEVSFHHLCLIRLGKERKLSGVGPDQNEFTKASGLLDHPPFYDYKTMYTVAGRLYHTYVYRCGPISVKLRKQ